MADLPGFTAEMKGWLDGRPFAGTVTVEADGSVAIKTDDPAAEPWLQDQLDSMVMHRQAPPAATAEKSEPKFRLVNEPEGHPLGKLIAVEGGQMASSYRIKDHQITRGESSHGQAEHDDHYPGERDEPRGDSCRIAMWSDAGTPPPAISSRPRRSRRAGIASAPGTSRPCTR